MQKKLIALAIAGLSSTAFAQSNVTISGQLKAGYERYTISNSAANNGSQSMFSDNTSSIVLKGTESLGNGLSAIFQIDNRFSVDTGNTSYTTATTTTGGAGYTGSLGSGNTHVGLKGGFGEIKLGRQDLHYNEIERIENGAKSLSQQATVGRGILNSVNGTFIGPAQTRSNNVLFWDSANYGGFTARVAYSTNPFGTEGATTGNADKGSAWNAVVRYENGPIKTGFSYFDIEREGGQGATAATSDQKSARAWGAWAFAGFSLGLAYDRSELETTAGNARRNGWAIPVSYNFGNHGIYATYARTGNTTGALAGVAGGDNKAKQWVLGYDYNLSKRTSVGVNYTKLDNNSGAGYNFGNNKGTGLTAGAGEDAKQFYVGVRHAY